MQRDGITTQLPDGETITIRPITTDDRQALVAGFAETSRQSRYLRFMRSVDQLTEAELDYLVSVDGTDHVALAAIAADGSGLGVGRYIRDKTQPSHAEAAVMVTDEHHGRGIGTALVKELAEHAAANNVAAFVAYVLPENRAVIDGLLKAGAEVKDDGSALLMTVRLPIDPSRFSDSLLKKALRRAAAGEYRLREA